jgi:hypothetical protein
MEFNYFTPKEQEEIARKKHKNSHKNYDNQEISDKLSSADSCGDTENKNDSGLDDDNMEFINVLDESEETDSDEDDKEESVFFEDRFQRNQQKSSYSCNHYHSDHSSNSDNADGNPSEICMGKRSFIRCGCIK